jgi:hypothetical protein
LPLTMPSTMSLLLGTSPLAAQMHPPFGTGNIYAGVGTSLPLGQERAPVGCSHPGIDNIVEAAAINPKSTLPPGGFRLVIAPYDTIAKTVAAL